MILLAFQIATAPVAALPPCRAADGDTIICGKEHIRLTAIDSPEMPGHCRVGRSCAPGDPFKAKAAMDELVKNPLGIVRLGTDHYGRTVGDVYTMTGSQPQSLSCLQLQSGNAIYWRKFDKAKRIKNECGL